ncbi:hypothetical protein EVB91_168 [Rhizobium phage RHph_I1_18]|nr:hypothetical protein EVB91_168 [Rhizobium phage RHph_I1_18]
MRTMPMLTVLGDKVQTYLNHSSYWLANGREAEEQGNKAKAEKCFEKSQFWLDHYNKAAGNS